VISAERHRTRVRSVTGVGWKIESQKCSEFNVGGHAVAVDGPWMLTMASCVDGGMTTMIELLLLVTLTLSLVSSPSHASLHHTQQQTLDELLGDEQDLQLPAKVRKLTLKS